jgi:hypothetical protein
MPKRSNKSARRPAEKSPAKAKASAASNSAGERTATSLTYSAWRAQAAAALGRPGVMPEHKW